AMLARIRGRPRPPRVLRRVRQCAQPTLGPQVRSRHLGPLVLLTVMVGIFFSPQLVGGTTQWDGVDVHYSSQRYFSDAVRSGHLPFWTPYISSGFPFLADVQVGAWYPLNWPFFLVGVTPNSMSYELLLHGLIACVGAHVLAIHVLHGNRPASLAAAMFYGLSGYFAGHSQHVGMVETAAWLPWLVLGVLRLGECVSGRRLAVWAIVGAAIALPGHFQTALYAFCGVAVWALVAAAIEANKAHALRAVLALAATAVWGGAMAAVMILPGLELTRQSIRAG